MTLRKRIAGGLLGAVWQLGTDGADKAADLDACGTGAKILDLWHYIWPSWKLPMWSGLVGPEARTEIFP